MKNKALDQIDAVICKSEKSIAGGMFLLMSVVVLADVVHRVFSRTPGRIATITSSWFHLSPEALDPLINRFVIPAVLLILAYGAIQSRARATTGTRMRFMAAGGRAALGVGTFTVLVNIFIKFVPSGLVWSPYFGLCCLLWLGLLGASIATYQGQHLALEMGEKLWPESWRPIVGKFSAFLVGGFCAFICVLAFFSVKDHYVDWSSSPGAGLIPSIDWPKWMVYLIVPYSFAMMAFRFCGRAFGLLNEPEKKDERGGS